jgi:chemotaxis methyl-accepting protein methylase
VARGFESAGYCPAVLEARIGSRLSAVGVAGYDDYLRVLETSKIELDFLAEALTIKVSSFFRDPFVFEYLNEFVLPAILAEKAATGDRSVRIWSAGCANGEEPYSIAILLHELIRRENFIPEVAIFATDIDEKALGRGREALYAAAGLDNVRRGLLKSSFLREGDLFRVLPAIARTVGFSRHDMLDQRTASPAESVFGTFDLILCRNLLIYFLPDYQEIIFGKLHRSLAAGGYLLLGRTETLPESRRGCLYRVNECTPLYRKPARGGGSWREKTL